jgi:hypothetical protein
LTFARKEGGQQFCSLRAAPLKGAYDWMARKVGNA